MEEIVARLDIASPPGPQQECPRADGVRQVMLR
jgi:hypothetical protein